MFVKTPDEMIAEAMQTDPATVTDPHARELLETLRAVAGDIDVTQIFDELESTREDSSDG